MTVFGLVALYIVSANNAGIAYQLPIGVIGCPVASCNLIGSFAPLILSKQLVCINLEPIRFGCSLLVACLQRSTD